mmetsp:Transcript_7508/g.18118  ORF Transcript_7508/g.18118 Transcript_7508/m.18118 type:complete len:244 (-) Transcript_7508:1037-1768(-)
MRWVCASLSRGGSQQMTFRIEGTSSPRAATSVATSTWMRPALKSRKILSRSTWCLSPCRHAHRKSNFTKFTLSSSVATFCPTKMITSPSSTIAGRASISQAHLCDASGKTRTTWRTSEDASPMLPTVTWTGWLRRVSASSRIRFLNVAENISVCRSGRICPRMHRICNSNPMSSMRSASSRTRNVTRLQFVALDLSISIRRPGVPTMISAPRKRSRRCSFFDAPPYTPTTFTPQLFENFFASV